MTATRLTGTGGRWLARVSIVGLMAVGIGLFYPQFVWSSDSPRNEIDSCYKENTLSPTKALACIEARWKESLDEVRTQTESQCNVACEKKLAASPKPPADLAARQQAAFSRFFDAYKRTTDRGSVAIDGYKRDPKNGYLLLSLKGDARSFLLSFSALGSASLVDGGKYLQLKCVEHDKTCITVFENNGFTFTDAYQLMVSPIDSQELLEAARAVINAYPY
jgi:hypothetical protein